MIVRYAVLDKLGWPAGTGLLTAKTKEKNIKARLD